LPAGAVARLGQVETAQLETWAEQIFDATTLIEVLGHPEH
jgi:hypothetical protein